MSSIRDVVSAGIPKFEHTDILFKKFKNLYHYSNAVLVQWGFPDDTEVVSTSEGISADCFHPDWLCFHEFPFTLGLKLPFPKLMNDFLVETKICPGQLMPNVWRILFSLNHLSSKFGFEIHASDLMVPYSWRMRKGRVNLQIKKGASHLIFDVKETNDRGWPEQYFFVKMSPICNQFANKWIKGNCHFQMYLSTSFFDLSP